MLKYTAAILFILAACLDAHSQRQFWGTASSAGNYGNGFIFKTDSIGDNLEIIHHFKSSVDGENIGTLLLASNNKLYGLASAGGQGGTNVFSSGTLFEYDLNTNEFRVVKHFGPLGDMPNAVMPKAEGLPGLTEVSPGLIYGLARQGGYVFSYNFNTGAFGNPFVLPNYQGGPTNSIMQNSIAQAFFKAADGNLYAATTTNSSCPIANPYMGSIVRVIPSTNAFAIRHKASCQAENGFTYNGHFAELNGKLYGTTQYGGTANQGVLFEYTPSTNTFVKRHDFQGGVATNSFSLTSLVARNGKLYGTSHGGGVPEQNLPGGGGTLYEFDPQTSTFTNKYNFIIGTNWLGDVGTFPSSLINSTNGKLYGCTEYGVFEFNTTTGTLRMAGRFWDRGFAPSIVQVCRKPSYKFQTATTREVCKDAAFSFDVESANATTVEWKHNNVTDLSKNSTSLTFESFSESDAGTWVCIMTNECGTTTSQTLTLVLNEPSQPAITTEGPLAFCDGGSVTLRAPEGFEGYAWSNGETSQEIVVTEGGEYSVVVNNGCDSPPSSAVTVTVHELPESPTEIEVMAYDKLKAIGNSDIYEWTLNGVLLDDHDSEISVTESGDYQARAVSAEGCFSEGAASLSFIVTALEPSAESHVTFSPNPASRFINVGVPESWRGEISLSFFNSSGQLIAMRSQKIESKNNKIGIDSLPAGLYHVVLRKGRSTVVANLIIQ